MGSVLFFGLFISLDVGLCYWFYRVCLAHLKAWRERVSNTRITLMLIAAVLLLVAFSTLAMMVFLTVVTCFSAITGGRWDGAVFVIYWIVGFFVYAFVLGFCDPLHAGTRAAYEELI